MGIASHFPVSFRYDVSTCYRAVEEEGSRPLSRRKWTKKRRRARACGSQFPLARGCEGWREKNKGEKQRSLRLASLYF